MQIPPRSTSFFNSALRKEGRCEHGGTEREREKEGERERRRDGGREGEEGGIGGGVKKHFFV